MGYEIGTLNFEFVLHLLHGNLNWCKPFFATNLCLRNAETVLMFHHAVNVLGHAVLHVLFFPLEPCRSPTWLDIF